jgi:hypothetical protein
MVISDIFSSSFLFSIAIIVILIGGIFAYVSYRMTEQDHKLTSMVNVVSLLVQDLQFVKSKLNNKSTNDDNNDDDNNENIKYSSDIMGGDLISVSDCEDEDEDEAEEASDEEEEASDEEEHQDDDQDEDLDIGDIDIGEETNDTIKLLNLSLVNNDPMEDHEINILDETEYHNDNNDNNDNNDINTTKTIHLDFAEETDEKQELNDDIIKSIGAEIDIEDLNKTDYKKMSLNKLRELVVSKGIVNDASKLKKHDILKLLGEE